MTFIIADSQELTRFAIERMLDEYSDKEILHASNKSDLVALLRTHEQCVIIIDYTLFDFPDIQSLINLTQRYPLSNWLLMSEDLTEQLMRTLVYHSSNASILFKDSPLKEIDAALRSVQVGHRFICQRVTEVLLARQRQEVDSRSPLTHTEIEIIRAITQGKTTKEIAAERFSSVHTINTHRKNIFRKLGVNTAHEAVKAAVRSGLIDESEYYI